MPMIICPTHIVYRNQLCRAVEQPTQKCLYIIELAANKNGFCVFVSAEQQQRLQNIIENIIAR